MPEILTESFCERCGTRYTFEAAIPKKRRIGKLKVLSKGLRNYVLSDDASLDEALAEARSEEQRELTGGQLDAFHQAFQFCMSCRQYTCANCWNEAEGRCLSCAPLSTISGQAHSPLDDLLAGGGMSALVSPPIDPTHDHSHPLNGNGNGHALIGEPPVPALNGSAWPTIDLFGPVAEPAAESVVAAEPEPAVAEPPGPEPVLAAGPQLVVDEPSDATPPADFWAHPFTGFAPVVEPTNGHDPLRIGDPDQAGSQVTPVEAQVEPALEPQPAASTPDVEVDARAEELAARTNRLLGRLRVQPRSAATPAAVAQPAPVVEPEPAPAPAPAPEAPVAYIEPAPWPEPAIEAAVPELAPEPELELTPEPPAARIDRVEMPAWPTPAEPAWRLTPPAPTPPDLELAGRPDPAPTPAPVLAPPMPVQASAPPARLPGEAPQWPAPLRPGVDLSVPAPWASRDTSRDAGLWMASAQEVTGASSQAAVPGGVQSCVSCGLSLSATARFCRRCGSAQG